MKCVAGCNILNSSLDSDVATQHILCKHSQAIVLWLLLIRLFILIWRVLLHRKNDHYLSLSFSFNVFIHGVNDGLWQYSFFFFFHLKMKIIYYLCKMLCWKMRFQVKVQTLRMYLRFIWMWMNLNKKKVC